MKKTLVLGASPKPSRYSNQAVWLLREYGHQVVAVGIRQGKIRDAQIQRGKPEADDIHTITLYIGAKRQPEYYDYIVARQPERLIFNPGTENPELEEIARQNQIEVVKRCTLVMLNTGNY